MARANRFRRTTFKNGLTLLTERLPEFKTLAIGFWVRAGTRHEKPGEAGISHFLEHMLFKGTELRSALEIAREVDQVGGEFNAFTTREYTCFHMTLLDRDVNLGLDILCDVVLNSSFVGEEFERERKVILQEIAMVDESPEEAVHDLFFEKLYGRHGLGRPILGSGASIRRVRRMDLLRFFRKHYRPEQIIVSVAGNVSHEAVSRKLRALTGGEWPGRAPRRESNRELGVQRAPKLKAGRWWSLNDTEQVHVIWGVEGHHYASRDRFAAFLLNQYLGGGMSSTLFQEIREKKGLAYTVYSMLSPFTDSGVFSIYAATGMNQVPLCLKLIEEAIEKMKRTLLTDEELRVLKDNLKGTVLLSSDSSESRMHNIAMNELFLKQVLPEMHTPEGVCRQIDAVTPQDIRRVARKLFKPGRASILTMGPRPTRSVKSQLERRFGSFKIE